MSDEKQPEDTAKDLVPDDKDVNLLAARPVQSPLLWFFLLFVPLVLALVSGMIYQISADDEPPPTEQEQVAEAEAVEPRGPVPVTRSSRIDTSLKCDFGGWEGRIMSDEFEARIKTLGRPYRILPPGSMMTMDHSPARINFELNARSQIVKIWCG